MYNIQYIQYSTVHTIQYTQYIQYIQYISYTFFNIKILPRPSMITKCVHTYTHMHD